MLRDTPLSNRIARELGELRDAGLWRKTADATDARVTIDLSTNSYLSLHGNAQVRDEADRLCRGLMAGNLASRLVGTPSVLYDTLEAEIAAWKHAESALVFGSGYAANLGIIQSLCTRATEVFSDRLNHASIIDGIRLSQAKLTRYAHCDLAELAARLARSEAAEKVIVTESVFSMDGDLAPLADICQLAHQHGAFLMVDEAHAVGVFGPHGEGAVEELGCRDGVDVVVGTLSKAVAGVGGYFAGAAALRDYFVNNCRSLIYSTGLPASALAWDLAAVRHIRNNPGLGSSLLQKAAFLRALLQESGFDTGLSSTQIVSTLVPGNAAVVVLSKHLRAQGIKAPAIRSPTVPPGAERVRFSLNSAIGEAQLETLAGVLREWKGRAG